MLRAKEKISKAKTHLVIGSPFFATIALRMDYLVDNSQPTIWTDGDRIGFNEKFVEGLTIEELKGVLIHEVYHIITMHHLRRGNRNHLLFNIAGDYAINLLISDAGITLPLMALMDRKYTNMEAEKIYNLLLKDVKDRIKTMGGQCNGDCDNCPAAQDSGDGEEGNTICKKSFEGDIGSVKDPKGEEGRKLSESEMKHKETETKILIKQAYDIAKRQGKVPEGIERLVYEILEPKVNWKEALQEFIAQNTRNDYSWSKRNKRLMVTQREVYFPSLERPELGHLVLGIDTSGSIGQKELDEIAAEVNEIMRTFQTKLTVIYCDSAVAGVEEFEGDDYVTLKPYGGGGTDYRPVFEKVDKEDIDPIGLIYFTDGYCYSFPKNIPDYKVLWILTKKINDFRNTFGNVVFINN